MCALTHSYVCTQNQVGLMRCLREILYACVTHSYIEHVKIWSSTRVRAIACGYSFLTKRVNARARATSICTRERMQLEVSVLFLCIVASSECPLLSFLFSFFFWFWNPNLIAEWPTRLSRAVAPLFLPILPHPPAISCCTVTWYIVESFQGKEPLKIGCFEKRTRQGIAQITVTQITLGSLLNRILTFFLSLLRTWQSWRQSDASSRQEYHGG